MDSQYLFINKLLDSERTSYEFLKNNEENALDKLDKLIRSNELAINFISSIVNQIFYIPDCVFIYLEIKQFSILICFIILSIIIDIFICLLIKLCLTLSNTQIFMLKIIKFILIFLVQIWITFFFIISSNNNNVTIKSDLQVLKCTNLLSLLCLFWTIFCFNYNIIMSILTMILFNSTVIINIFTFFKMRQIDYYAELILMNIIIILGLWYKSRERETIDNLIPVKHKAIVSYFEEIINSLNTFIVSFKNNNVLFMNDYLKNYVIVNRKISEAHQRGESLIKFLDKSENKDDKIKIIETSEIYEFLKSLKIKSGIDKLQELYDNNVNIENLYELLIFEFQKCNNHLDKIERNLDNNYKLKKIGIFTDGYCFLDVNTRINKINNEYVLDLVMFDISEIIKSEKLKAEQKYKKIMFSKIAHEFKTPLIDSITICSNILENTNNDIIQQNIQNLLNLSYYSIFLTENLILYCNSAKLDEKQDINLYELIISCTNIIESVVLCNGNPNKNSIKLEMECEINNCVITENLFGLKQILLNIFWLQQKSSKAEEISIQLSFNEENKIIEFMTKINIYHEKLKEILSLKKDSIEINIESDYNDMDDYGLSIISKLSEQMQININIIEINKEISTIIIPFSKYERCISCNSFLQQNEISKKEENPQKELSESHKSVLSNHNLSIDTISGNLNINLEEMMKNNTMQFSNKQFYDLRVTKYEKIFISGSINFCNELLKILIVEDNKTIRDSNHNLLKKCLKELKIQNKYEIIICCDGIEILYYLFKDRYTNLIKLILSDENMDYLNGSEAFELCTNLIKKSKFKKCPFITITAFVDEFVIDNIIKSGSDTIINKPLKLDDLMKCLIKYISINQ